MNIREKFDIFQLKRAEIVHKELRLDENKREIKYYMALETNCQVKKQINHSSLDKLKRENEVLESEINQLYDEMLILAGSLPPYLGEY